MARQKRKLKYLPKESSKLVSKVHFDTNDNLFASEHYGYYLMCSLSDSSNIKNPRKYFYYKYKKEYYVHKIKMSNKKISQVSKISKSCILDRHIKQEKLILDIVKTIFYDKKPEKLTESLLIAIGIVLDIFDINDIVLNNINDFKTKHQFIIYDYMHNDSKLKNQDKRDVTRFFAEVDKYIDTFELILPKKLGIVAQRKVLGELTSSMMYQLEYYSLKELSFIKNKVEEYQLAVKEKEHLFSLKNLLFTLFYWKDQRLSTKKIYPKLIIHKIKIDYGLDASIILKSRIKKDDLIKISEMKKLSENGISLLNDEKYAVIWTKELFPYYPKNINLNKKYESVTKTLYARKFILIEFGLTVEEIETYLYPNKLVIYPLYLLLLIRTGLNNETLLKWEVEKFNLTYKLKSDDLGLVILIESEKKRSNSLISCVLKYDSDEIKYINFYVNWAKDIYNNSNQKKLFQYFDRGSTKEIKIETLNSKTLSYLKNSPKSFYLKYEIYNMSNKRIYFIDHRLIRKSHNFQEYLKGKEEFERQIKKKHVTNHTTKKYYENNSIEWNNLKKYKISKSQNLIISIFNGEIQRDENPLSNILNGSIADCKNNKNPTYTNVKSLKKNEYCLDWTKCLTSCEQACVIPKVHGPVIFAWIDFMNNQKKEFINEEHWEKEYLYDYESAIDTIKYFTKSEKEFCKSQKLKHKEFVKMILEKRVSIGKTNSA